MQYLRAFCERNETNEQGSGPIRFVASTEGVKRDGKSLIAQDWRLENYQRNPVVLWVHDYTGQNLPIGRAIVAIEGTQLMADVEFDQEDGFARRVEGKYRRGYLSAVSVGWQDVKEGKQVYHDLMDVSAVPVPADPMALKVQEARALRGLLNELDPNVSEADSDVDVWGGVANAMLAVYRNHSAIEEDDRKALWIVLERAYRKLGKEAPEYMAHDDLVGLEWPEIRGLFLEGEPELRAGAVLNGRNRGALEQARDLIQGVLNSAEKAQDSGETGQAACDDEKRQAEQQEPEDDTETQIRRTLEQIKNKIILFSNEVKQNE